MERGAYCVLMVVSLLLLFTSRDEAATPEGVDQETYCSICKISAEVFHSIAPSFGGHSQWDEDDEKGLKDSWNQLCAYKNFQKYKDQHPVKTIVNGCKFLQDSSEVYGTGDDDVSQDAMYEMVRQILFHDGEVKGMQSAMCYTTSDACKKLNKAISDLDGQTVDVSPEQIQKILNNPNIRRPSPIRTKTEL